MNIQETALVVGKIAVYDKRTFTEETVLAWHDVIGDLNYHDCLDAVTEHFRSSGDYLLPAHIRRTAKRYQEARELEQAKARDPRNLTTCTAPTCRCTHTACDGVWLSDQQVVIRQGRQYRQSVRCPECTRAAGLHAAA